MADIVQLEEKGTVLYPKTHVKALEGLVDFIYPVGSIYMSSKNLDVNTLLGGSWERIKGKTLIGVDEADPDFAAGKTGGQKTHQLNIFNIPNRVMKWVSWKGGLVSYSPWQSGNVEKGKIIATNPHDAGDEFGRPISNVQPYETVYMWKRIK